MAFLMPFIPGERKAYGKDNKCGINYFTLSLLTNVIKIV
jgi:hypothetical protein